MNTKHPPVVIELPMVLDNEQKEYEKENSLENHVVIG